MNNQVSAPFTVNFCLTSPVVGFTIDDITIAVSQFQKKFFSQILTPWGMQSPSGWWYQSTRGYANYLENCTEEIIQLDNTIKLQDGTIVQ